MQDLNDPPCRLWHACETETDGDLFHCALCFVLPIGILVLHALYISSRYSILPNPLILEFWMSCRVDVTGPKSDPKKHVDGAPQYWTAFLLEAVLSGPGISCLLVSRVLFYQDQFPMLFSFTVITGIISIRIGFKFYSPSGSLVRSFFVSSSSVSSFLTSPLRLFLSLPIFPLFLLFSGECFGFAYLGCVRLVITATFLRDLLNVRQSIKSESMKRSINQP